jgi:titin
VQTLAQARDQANSHYIWSVLYDATHQGIWFYPYNGAGASSEVFTGLNSVPTNTWFQVEVQYTATATGGAHLYINGQTNSAWGVSGDFSQPNGDLQRVVLWNDSSSSTTDFDDVTVATVPATVPGAPTAVQGAVRDKAVALSWTAPSDGGSPITGYRVTPYVNGTAQTPILTNSSAANYTVTGLTDGTAYTFTVAAINAVGTSADSAASAAVTPAPPTAPAVTVTNTAGAALSTQLSTNSVWPGMLDQTPNGQAELNALQAPYVRLHVGDDGDPKALPEIDQGQWDFSHLNGLVNNVFAARQQPLMNIKFAPDWMWTCYPKTISKGDQGSGSVADQTFHTFAQYMARLVSYYNQGSMTTETGQVINNPAGTSHAIQYWELWNEPDLTNETPCGDPSGSSLSPDQYVTMWNAVTAAMLQVDPALKFVGPATAGSQFGSSNATGNQYIDDLMTNAVTRPAAISFHGYGYWDNGVTDKLIFDGGDPSNPASKCCGGITGMVDGVTTVRSAYPSTPVWLTEVNVNADWAPDPNQRPSGEFAAAWWGAMFADTVPLGVGLIHQFDLDNGDPQFSLLNSDTGDPYVAYYVLQLLDQAFPSESTQLSSSSNDPGILSLAARKPDGTISVLVVNRKLASDTAISSCGKGGVATPVNISLPRQPVSVSVQQIDKTNINCSTGAASAPVTRTVSGAPTVTVTFPGYGIALLNLR